MSYFFIDYNEESVRVNYFDFMVFCTLFREVIFGAKEAELYVFSDYIDMTTMSSAYADLELDTCLKEPTAKIKLLEELRKMRNILMTQTSDIPMEKLNSLLKAQKLTFSKDYDVSLVKDCLNKFLELIDKN